MGASGDIGATILDALQAKRQKKEPAILLAGPTK